MQIYVTKEFYSTKLSEAKPGWLFIFGDNTKRYGKAGQAQIRDTKNAIGLATKFTPSVDNDAYFSDQRYSECCDIIEKDLQAIFNRSEEYDVLIFPFAGLGTGLSELPKRAPRVYTYLCSRLEQLFGIHTNMDGTLWYNTDWRK